MAGIFNLTRAEVGHSFSRASLFPNATVNIDVSPEYMGVGYVIGPRIAGTMFAGGVLSWLVLLPLMSIMGAAIPTPFPPITPANALNPATGNPFLISEITTIWSAYIRYIGAGAVLAAGLIAWHGRCRPSFRRRRTAFAASAPRAAAAFAPSATSR